jgi:hypothetical protein
MDEPIFDHVTDVGYDIGMDILGNPLIKIVLNGTGIRLSADDAHRFGTQLTQASVMALARTELWRRLVGQEDWDPDRAWAFINGEKDRPRTVATIHSQDGPSGTGEAQATGAG